MRAPPLGQPDQIAHSGTADAVDTPRTRSRYHLALARERGVRDLPSRADVAHATGIGNQGPVEEHLVEVDLTPHVAQRAHLHPLLVQIDEEVGEPLPLRDVVVGPGQKDRPVRKMGPRGPYLLAGDDPLIAVALGPGGQRGEIGAGPGLAEELAPDLLVADDGREEAPALLLGAVREECGSRQIQAERVEAAQVEGAQLFVGPPRHGRREIETSIGPGPGGHHEARSSKGRIPRLVVGSGPPARPASTHVAGTAESIHSRTAPTTSSTAASGARGRRPTSSLVE